MRPVSSQTPPDPTPQPPRRRPVGVVVFAVIGLLLAAGVTYAASTLVSQPIGLTSEPVTAGDALAPTSATTTTAPSTTTTPATTVTTTTVTVPVPPPVTTTTTSGGDDHASGDDDHGGGHDDDGDDD